MKSYRFELHKSIFYLDRLVVGSYNRYYIVEINNLTYLKPNRFTYISEDEYLLHREDGPAIEFSNGSKRWYSHGERIHCKDNEDFLKIIKMKAFL